MSNFKPVYNDLTIKYQNNVDTIKNIQKINIVKITNNEIFTNYRKKKTQQLLIFILFFLFIFYFFKFFYFFNF